MRKLSFRAKASIAILMAVMLIANANLAFADDRGDRRGGKFEKPGLRDIAIEAAAATIATTRREMTVDGTATIDVIIGATITSTAAVS